MLPREKAVFLNQNLIRCICAGVPDPKNPTSCAKAVAQGDDPNDLVKYPRDCATRTVDPNDDQDWNERLLNAKGEEVTGTYTFEGKRCGGADSNPTETCPIQVKAAFDVQCSPGTTKCVAAQTISAYYSIKLAVEVKGTMTVMQSVRPTTAVVFETGTISSR